MFTRTFSPRAQASPSPAPRFAVPVPSLVPERIQAPRSTVTREENEREPDDATIRRAATYGLATPPKDVPFANRMQAAFAGHDISDIQAHTGPEATASAQTMGASAFATGNHVVFAGTPDLRTVAHEVAHVVQQRAGVQLAGSIGSIGRVGDAYERQADAVAARVAGGGQLPHLPFIPRAFDLPLGRRIGRGRQPIQMNKTKKKREEVADETVDKRKQKTEEFAVESRKLGREETLQISRLKTMNKMAELSEVTEQEIPTEKPPEKKASDESKPEHEYTSDFEPTEPINSQDDLQIQDEDVVEDEIQDEIQDEDEVEDEDESIDQEDDLAETDNEDDDIEELAEEFAGLQISEPVRFQSVGAEGDIEEEHKVYWKTDDIFVESNPKPLKEVIKNKKWENHPLTTTEVNTLNGLRGKAKKRLYKIAGKAARLSKGIWKPKIQGSRTKKKMNKFLAALTSIATFFAKLAGPTHAATLMPPTNLTKSADHGNNAPPVEGSHVKAAPLSINSTTPGTKPHDGRLMKAIRTAAAVNGENSSYVQMHLLNDLVFGPGELWNLTPGPKKSNKDMETNVEHFLKRAILGKGLVINFEAKVKYKKDPQTASSAQITAKPGDYIFQYIEFKAEQLKYDKATKKWVKATTQDADVQAIHKKRVNWNYGGLKPLP